ncbi:hypothetical protein F4801DRAFT_423919 [Xylaria longipes]|nr:hypothetical protein F4801DRAFT_423919 [Xylaria longipes]RYC55170.1 hypothetical protein CHU98_g11034 [Xylaria longipes]
MTVEMQRQDVPPKSGQLAAPKRKRADTSSSTEPITTSNKRQCLTKSLCLSNEDDAKVLKTIDARYEVQLQSVISSSKIQQRVTAMLRHLTPPTQSPSSEPAPDATTTTSSSKIRVSILRAKATEAGKLVSIAEIAKREIEKELSVGDDGVSEAGQERKTGRWFQYIALGEELIQKPRDEGNTIIEETVLGDPGADKEDHDGDDEFEVMKTPFERAIEGRPLVRGVPVMSLFLSRSPIEELKKRYGEQTNVPPT